MKRLRVHYRGWGEDWPLGHLADDGRVLFEYTPEALAQGLELSPLRMKLRAQAYGGFPAHLDRLPSLIADSLPDGWRPRRSAGRPRGRSCQRSRPAGVACD